MLLKGRYQLYRCADCGTQFLRALDGSPETSDYWSEQYKFDIYSSGEVRLDYEGRYRAIFDQVEAIVGPVSSVLDLGCGVGNFLAFASGQGWRAVGFDSDPRAVRTALGRGFAAFSDADALNAEVPDCSMDAGTMWDVIEHMVAPRPVVRDLVKRIRPGGGLVIETPDANFPVRPFLRWLRWASGGRIKLSGKMYYWEHKVYFTEEGLSRLVRSEGCEVVKVLHMNSPHVKMTKIFQHSAAQGNLAGRLLSRTWPFLDGATRRLGLGNKLVLLARKSTE